MIYSKIRPHLNKGCAFQAQTGVCRRRLSDWPEGAAAGVLKALSCQVEPSKAWSPARCEQGCQDKSESMGRNSDGCSPSASSAAFQNFFHSVGCIRSRRAERLQRKVGEILFPPGDLPSLAGPFEWPAPKGWQRSTFSANYSPSKLSQTGMTYAAVNRHKGNKASFCERRCRARDGQTKRRSG